MVGTEQRAGRTVFKFKRFDMLEDLIDFYQLRPTDHPDVLVDPRSFVSAQRNLKEIIHQQSGGRSI